MTTKCTPAAARPIAAGDVVSGLMDAFTGSVTGIFSTVAEWQRRANERQQLRHIDDRLLRDMGIRRIDAVAEANKPFWKA